MRIFNKLVFSKKEPSNKNDIWFDGKDWKVFIEGEWKDTSKFKEDATTPDWNAQEGEVGYIENRTHYTKKVNGEIFHVTDDIYDVHYKINQSDNELIDDVFYLRMFYTDGANISFNKVYKSSNFHNGLELGTIETPLGRLYIYVYMETDNIYTIVVTSADGGYFNKEGVINEFIVEKIYALDEQYLPDTVLKTTPQSLSDTDKNQALANLGIDPVVWKYMCNPYIIEPESYLPGYLHQLLVNNNPLILNLCKIKVEVDVYDDIADAIRPIVHFCTPIAYKYNDEPDRALSLQCITFYDNTYHTYYVEIDESDGHIYDITEIVTNENNS